MVEGGAITSELTTTAAYGVLILSAALGVWTLSSALAIGGVLGSLFFAAAFLGLAFDVVDLFRLTSGELSPEDYLVEMAAGLLLEAALGGLGDVARRLGVGQLADEVVQRVIRQWDEVTDGAIGRLMRGCPIVAVASVVAAGPCVNIKKLLEEGVTAEEIRLLVVNSRAEEIFARFPEQMQVTNDLFISGEDIFEQLLINDDLFADPRIAQEAVELILNAPRVNNAKFSENLASTVWAAISRENYGYLYELKRALNRGVPAGAEIDGALVAYNKRVPIEFQTVVGYDRTTKRPILGNVETQEFEGDLVFETVDGKVVYIDAKYKRQDAGELRIWKQLRKAAEALNTGVIDEYRIECSGNIPQPFKDYVSELAEEYPGLNLEEKIKIFDKIGDNFN